MINRTGQREKRAALLTIVFLLFAWAIWQPQSIQAQAQWDTNGTDAYRLSGSIGVGTNSPTTKLTITDGVAPYASGATDLLQLKRGTSNGSSGSGVSILLGNSSNGFRITYGGTTDRLGFLDGGNIEVLSLLNGGNVGIGTTTPVFDANPTRYLSLNGGSGTFGSFGVGGNITSAAYPVGQMAFFNSSLGVSDKRVATIVGRTDGAVNSGAIDFYTWNVGSLGGAPRMTIAAVGNVGIGTTTPTSALEVQAPDGPLTLSQSGVAGKSVIQAAVGTDLHLTANGKYSYPTWNRFDTSLPSWNIFLSPSADYMGIRRSAAGAGTINWSEFLVIRNTGNVGIGTSTPAYRLDVNGQIRSSSGGFVFPDGTVQTTAATGGGGSQWTTSGSNIYYNAGNVGIGTATPGSYYGVPARLDVSGAAHTLINVNAGAGYSSAITFSENGAARWALSSRNSLDAPNNRLSLFNNSATEVFTILNSGNVGIGTISPSTFLDIKGNNVPYAGQLRIQAADYAQLTFYNSGNPTVGAAGRKGEVYYDFANSLMVIENSNGGAFNGSILMNPVGGTVGIGTATPDTNYKLDVAGSVKVSGNIAAKYQDVAEWVESRQKLAAGTVVILDPEKSNQVIASTEAYDTRVAGVVSAQPGVILGEEGVGKVKVATTGRVRVRVDASRGPIKIGDLLVTSDKEGMAMKSEPINLNGRKIHAPGTIIGKALEPLEKGEREILVLLSLQ